MRIQYKNREGSDILLAKQSVGGLYISIVEKIPCRCGKGKSGVYAKIYIPEKQWKRMLKEFKLEGGK